MTVTAGICSGMQRALLTVHVLLLLLVFCNNQLETSAQNDTIIITPSPVHVISSVSDSNIVDSVTSTSISDMINETAASINLPTIATNPVTIAASPVTIVTSPVTIVTSPVTIAASSDMDSMTSMDVVTLTNMISDSTSTTVPLSLTPTGAFMVDTSMPVLVVSFTTVRAVASSVDVVNTSPIIMIMTTVAMTSSSVVPTTTTMITTTSNPAPVPEDNGSSGFSTGVIAAIAAGGGAAFLVIFVIIICCCCCCHSRKHNQHIDIPMVMSPTIQVRHEEYYNWAYASQMSRVSRASTSSQLSLSQFAKSIRDSFRRGRDREKTQFEGAKLISSTVLSTPV